MLTGFSYIKGNYRLIKAVKKKETKGNGYDRKKQKLIIISDSPWDSKTTVADSLFCSYEKCLNYQPGYINSYNSAAGNNHKAFFTVCKPKGY